MSKAEYIEPVVGVVVPSKIVLTLSMEEAGTLFTILEHVGGDPDRSCRKYAASILDSILPLVGQFSKQVELAEDTSSNQALMFRSFGDSL